MGSEAPGGHAAQLERVCRSLLSGCCIVCLAALACRQTCERPTCCRETGQSIEMQAPAGATPAVRQTLLPSGFLCTMCRSAFQSVHAVIFSYLAGFSDCNMALADSSHASAQTPCPSWRPARCRCGIPGRCWPSTTWTARSPARTSCVCRRGTAGANVLRACFHDPVLRRDVSLFGTVCGTSLRPVVRSTCEISPSAHVQRCDSCLTACET